MCCAITGLLVSPLSWTHHWVWAVPLLVWLTAAAWRRRSVACGLAAAAGAAVFSGLLAIPWPGHPPRLGLMLASDQYVLYGLAVLAGTALALARECHAIGRDVSATPARRHRPIPDEDQARRASPHPPGLISRLAAGREELVIGQAHGSPAADQGRRAGSGSARPAGLERQGEQPPGGGDLPIGPERQDL